MCWCRWLLHHSADHVPLLIVILVMTCMPWFRRRLKSYQLGLHVVNTLNLCSMDIFYDTGQTSRYCVLASESRSLQNNQIWGMTMVKMFGLCLVAKATHIRWLHPGCTDRIFRAVTSTEQYDLETRNVVISICGRSKIKEWILVDGKQKESKTCR